MNRHARRAHRANLRAQADGAAALLARVVFDIGAQGHVAPVTQRLAIAALERGFRHVLRNGGEPHLMRISAEVAKAFPRHGSYEPVDWPWYLAVGIDCMGRGTYLLRPVLVEGATEVDARRLVETRMFEELRAHLEDSRPLTAVASRGAAR